jgi:hypothetical protein
LQSSRHIQFALGRKKKKKKGKKKKTPNQISSKMNSLLGGGKNAMAMMNAMRRVAAVRSEALSMCGQVAAEVDPLGNITKLEYRGDDAAVDPRELMTKVRAAHADALRSAQQQAAEIAKEIQASQKQ